MWVIWVSVAVAALISFYALLPNSHLAVAPPDMSAALAGDMAAYRAELEDYVAAHHSAQGAVPETAFAQNGNWAFTSGRWQNFVENGTVVVYPAVGKAPLPPAFVGAMLQQAGYSVEAGVAENGQIVNPLNTAGNVRLPADMPALSDGTPVWLAQSF